MRIGIDASRANVAHRTGTEWYSFALLQAFTKLEADHQFVLYTREPLRDDLQNLSATMDVRVLRWPPKRFWTQIRLSASLLRTDVDRLFVPAHTIPLIHPRITVTTLHDVGFARYPELYSRSELGYHRWATQYALKHAARILTVSEFSKKEIIELYGVADNRIQVIPLGYNAKQYNTNLRKEDIVNRQKNYQLTDSPYIISIGRLEQKKNTIGAIRGFVHAKRSNNLPHQLVLVGRPGYGYEEVQRTIIQLKAEDDVRLLGWVDEEDVPYLLSGSEAFLFPSFYEGFGIPVLEAMASGIPVVAARAGSLSEVGGDVAVLVDPYNVESIAEGILRALKPNERSERVRKGLQHVQGYQWSKCATETLAAITDPDLGNA